MPELTCGYSHPHDPDYKCGEDVWNNSERGLCIFHEPGKEKDVALFDEGIKRKLKDEDYDFRGYVFPGDTDYFRQHKFEKSATFERAVFLGDQTSFAKAEFGGELTSFSGAEFSGKQTYFSGAEFSGEQTGFSFAQFSGERTSFLDATFTGTLTDFSFAKFSGELTDFIEAEFMGKLTYFGEAKFSGAQTIFSSTMFGGELTSFAKAEFSSEQTHFNNAKFSGELTSFSYAQFRGERTSFSRAKFSGERTSFSGAKLSGKRIDFIEAEFMGQAVIFKEVDLSRVFFGDFKLLNRMDLTDITAWSQLEYYLGLRKRNTCADEIEAKTSDDFKAASRTLAALESVAKANHNASLASDFAYARRECNRKAHPSKIIQQLQLIFLAGFFGWGEKLSNIFASSVLFVFLLAFVFLFSGIHVKSAALKDNERPINREFSIPRIEEAIPTLKDFGNCLYFSAVTFTTLGYGDMRPAGPTSKALSLLEAFLGAFTIATFAALYLRRLLT